MINITLAQAAQFVLQKNYLTTQKATNLSQLVSDLAGLPGRPAITPFLAASARLTDFQPDDLLNALRQERTLLRCPLVRSVEYVVPVQDYVTWHTATARQRTKDLNADFRLWGVEHNEEIEQLGQLVLELVGDQSLTIDEIIKRLPADKVQTLTQTSRGGRVSETSNVALALRWLVGQGALYASNTASDWRSETLEYTPLNQVYPDIDLTAAPGEAEAQKVVVRSYLAAFGPATEADISFWTGFGKSETARATGGLSGETTLTMVQGIPGMLLSLKSRADSLRAVDLPADPVVNVLPADDPFVTAHRASRARYFGDQKLQRRVFSSSGAAKPTILVNGQIVGTWQWLREEDQSRLQWELFAEVEAGTVALIETELERAAGFVDPH